jgi:LuxR family transcriptional regulator, maltose regulon positive regulatory protein
MEAAVETVQPPLFRRHARRPRLTRLLDESTAQAILVTAPAGYGKTTLAMEWLQGREDVVWYRATNASADVAAFSAGLAETVAQLVPGAGERLRQRLRVADTPERAARPLAELLAEDLAAWPDGALLVIDDYHLVADSQPVEDFFDWLLTLAPGLRVLVTTRRRPRWASARRILYGEITEIGRDQLVMNAEEAGRVLEDRTPESVRALVAQAEGWPALIGLAALTAAREIPGERVSEALYRYLAEEVMRRESPEAERLMLIASVPVALDARVAEEVLNIDDPEPLLDGFVADGLLQPSGSQFRFHPLLRTFLRHKLEAEDPKLFAELTDKSIADARATERWEEAFELAIDISGALALEILEQAGAELLAAGRIETLDRWLAQLGEEGFRQPVARLVHAEVALRKGQLAQAAGLAEAAAIELAADSEHISRAWHLAGQALYLRSQSEAAARFQRRAHKFARGPEDMKRALWGLAMTETELGLDIAESRIDALQKLEAGDVNTKLRVGLGRQIIAASRGSFAGIWDEIQPLTSLADHADDPMAKTTLWANAAYLCVARAHYSEGAQLAERALESCLQFRLDFATGFCLGYLAAAEAGMRQFAAASQRLRELADLAERQDNAYLRLMHAVLSIRLALARGQGSQALNIEIPLPDVLVPPASRGELLSLVAIAAAVEGQFELAHQNVEAARRLTRAVEARFFSEFAELIEFRTTTNRVDEAESRSVELIMATAEADFLDAFVVAYRVYPELLLTLSKSSRLIALRGVIRRSNDIAFARAHGLSIGNTNPQTADLTKRETEVLSLLSRGLTNSQIAKRLFISESTVKVHVHRILAKLGAKTRLQAALIAQETLLELRDAGS